MSLRCDRDLTPQEVQHILEAIPREVIFISHHQGSSLPCDLGIVEAAIQRNRNAEAVNAALAVRRFSGGAHVTAV